MSGGRPSPAAGLEIGQQGEVARASSHQAPVSLKLEARPVMRSQWQSSIDTGCYALSINFEMGKQQIAYQSSYSLDPIGRDRVVSVCVRQRY
jgi:hypothetical protein